MFSQVSVCPQGVSAPLHAGIHTSRGIRGRQPPAADTPLGADPPAADIPFEQIPQEQTSPLKQTPRSRHPLRTVHAGRYGQQAGGTHPTGMHTCFHLKLHKNDNIVNFGNFAKNRMECLSCNHQLVKSVIRDSESPASATWPIRFLRPQTHYLRSYLIFASLDLTDDAWLMISRLWVQASQKSLWIFKFLLSN